MASLTAVVCKVTAVSRNICFNCCLLRSLSSEGQRHSQDWLNIYKERKQRLKDKYPVDGGTGPKHDTSGVFANNEICLSDIQVYGFDYDYTLASYKDELHHALYDLGKEVLVKKYNYPEAIIKQTTFHPEFALRGLHYDIRKGLLMKIDSYHNIQLGTVFRGTTKLSDQEVMDLYGGTHVPIVDMNTFYGQGPMYQLVDMFAPPEMNLITNVTDYFIAENIPYDPEYVFYDIRTAVQSVHSSGLLHQTIMDNLDKFLSNDGKTKKFLDRLSNARKKMFIITNSGFPFIDAGMKYMIGNDWRDMFEVVVVQARKPKFFNESARPFRLFVPDTDQSWGRVRSLDKGSVYIQGNYHDFQHMTGWYGSKVLYMGDHVYSDLADPSLKHGWRTAAIIPELEEEVRVISTFEHKQAVHKLIILQDLLEEIQGLNGTGKKEREDDDSEEVIANFLKERELLRNQLKSMCNPKFGSLFRTHHNPTYFSRRMARFADIYMSNLTNLLQYSINHTFYPRRNALPHEPYLHGHPSLYK